MEEKIRTKKLQFAKELLSKETAFDAALAVFESTADALRAAQQWVNDPIVIEEKSRLISEGEDEEYLPTKIEYARKVWKSVDEAKSEDGKLKMLRLYGEVRGFIEKPGTAASVTNITQNKVMVVNNTGTTDEWKKKLKSQQTKLINGVEVN